MTSQPLLSTSEAATIAVTYFTLAIPVAVLHTDAGTTPWLVLAAALIVNSATATVAFAAITAAGGGIFSGVLGGWLVSTRFGLLAAAVSPRLWPKKSAKAAAAWVAFDPNVALTLREPIGPGPIETGPTETGPTETGPAAASQAGFAASRRTYVTASLSLVVPWWLGTAVGILIGKYIDDFSVFGFDAMLPALFIAIIWPRLQERRTGAIGLAAAIVAVALIEPLPAGLSILAAAVVSFAALLGNRPKGPKENKPAC